VDQSAARALAVLPAHLLAAVVPVAPQGRLTAAKVQAVLPVLQAVAARLPAIQVALRVPFRATIILMEHPPFHLQQSVATMPMRPGVGPVLEVRLQAHPVPVQPAAEQERRVAL